MRESRKYGLWQSGFQYGDWLALDIESAKHRPDRRNGQISGRQMLINAYSTRIGGNAADALGIAEEAKAFGDLYEKIVEAIHVGIRDKKRTRWSVETQTACVLMLYFDLIKPEFRNRILETLELNIGHTITSDDQVLWVHRICVIVCQKTVFTGWRMKSL